MDGEMAGDITLYPISSVSNIPGGLFLLLGLLLLCICSLVMVYFIRKKNRGEEHIGVAKESRGAQLKYPKLLRQLENLERNIGQLGPQEWYREYQQILRSYVGSTLGLDIQATSLKQIKYAYTAIPANVVRLLDQTYYFPYNLENGNEKIMRKEITALKELLS